MQPVIWVSRCLLGDRVRYDGGHRANGWVQALHWHAQIVPICPEVEAGLGVPRPPIDIVGGRVIDRAAGRDVTALLDAAIDARLVGEPPHAFIGKGRSPSCGRGSARRFDGPGDASGVTDGRFVARLRAAWPAVLICDAEQLTVEALAKIWTRAGAALPGALALNGRAGT